MHGHRLHKCCRQQRRVRVAETERKSSLLVFKLLLLSESNSEHVYGAGAAVQTRHPADGGDASTGSVPAAERTEETGRGTPAAAQRGRVPTGLLQTVPPLLTLDGTTDAAGAPHRHRHISAVDARPHQPDDTAASGTRWRFLEVTRRCQ